MTTFFWKGALAALVLFPSLPAAADPPEMVRVYTNSDLARLGPAPAAPSQPIVGGPVDWVDLDRFLERQYARIDADRRLELERLESERQDLLARSAAREELWIPSSAYWGAGWVGAPDGYGYVRGYCATKKADRPKRWGDLAGGKPAGSGAGRMSARPHGHGGGRRR